MQEGDYTPTRRTRDVFFAREEIDPPAPAYVDVDDVWEFGVLPLQQTPASVQANIRILRPTGGIETVIITQNNPGGNSQSVVTQSEREGYVLSATVTVSGMANPYTVYAWLGLRRTGNVAKNQMRVLCAGYATSAVGLGFPDRPAMRGPDGNGVVTWQSVSNPVAGADWTYTVPASLRVQIINGLAKLVTSATAGTRTVTLIGNNVGGQFMAIDSPNTQAASLTRFYNLGSLTPTPGVGGSNLPIPIPTPLILRGGDTLSSSTANISATDQWSAIVLQVIAWTDPF